MRANRNSIDLVVVEKKWLEKEGLSDPFWCSARAPGLSAQSVWPSAG
jgi:hypothetical protein